MSKGSELGTLIVVVLKARNLIDKHSFYKQDVYAQASLNGTTKQTHVDVKGGQHPVWDSELRFPVLKDASDKTRKIEVTCFAKEHRADDLLGKGTVDVTETLKTGEFDDWVGLDIDGVVRGEVYLEMTYFSSDPAPVVSKSPVASSLTVPRGQNLNRRPSKLPPSERLYRPLLSLTSQAQPVPIADRHPPSAAPMGRPSLSTSHSPSKSRDSALPPLPEKVQPGPATVPGILKPGGSQAQGSPQSSGPLPPILRPGNGTNRAYHSSASPSPSSSPRPTRQPSPSYGTSTFNGSSAPNPYLSAPSPTPSITIPPSGAPAVPITNYASYPNTILPATVPPLWDQAGPPTSNFSFPTPMLPTIPQPDLRQAEPYQYYGHNRNQPIISGIPSSPPPDPYLAARYQAPLPLPPGFVANPASSPPRVRQPELKPDNDRLHALKKAEEDTIRRREQEQRDLELAFRLDQELNT